MTCVEHFLKAEELADKNSDAYITQELLILP